MEDNVYFDVMSMNEACFDCRYNSGGKSFSEVTSTKHLSVSIDAVVIHNALWKTSAKPPQKRWNTGHAPNKVKVKAELPKLFNSMKKRRAALKGNPAVMRYATTEASHLSYYDALIPSYRILSKCLRDLYENTCDLLFYTYTRKISMLFNIKQYTIRNSYSFLQDYYSLSHPIFMCFFCILSCQEYLFLSSMLIKLYDWRKPFQICFKYCLVETWIFSLKLPLLSSL